MFNDHMSVQITEIDRIINICLKLNIFIIFIYNACNSYSIGTYTFQTVQRKLLNCAIKSSIFFKKYNKYTISF